MKTSIRLLIAAGLLATLAACGNKGPLVLPSPPPGTTPPTDSSMPVSPSTTPTIVLPPEHPTPPAGTGTAPPPQPTPEQQPQPQPTPPPADAGSGGGNG